MMMRRMMPWVAVGLVALLPILGGCESKQQREENAKLKAQVQALTQEKGELQRKADGAQQEQVQLKAKVDELTKKVGEAEAKLAAAAKPAPKPAAKPTVKPSAKPAPKPTIKK